MILFLGKPVESFEVKRGGNDERQFGFYAGGAEFSLNSSRILRNVVGRANQSLHDFGIDSAFAAI